MHPFSFCVAPVTHPIEMLNYRVFLVGGEQVNVVEQMVSEGLVEVRTGGGIKQSEWVIVKLVFFYTHFIFVVVFIIAIKSAYTKDHHLKCKFYVHFK